MEDKLWTIANGVTAFSILQTVAFLYAVTEKNVAIALTSPVAKWGLAVIGVLCGALYSYAVWRTYKMALTLSVEHKNIWRETTWGRLVAIIVFHSFSIVALFGLPFARDTTPPAEMHSQPNPTSSSGMPAQKLK